VRSSKKMVISGKITDGKKIKIFFESFLKFKKMVKLRKGLKFFGKMLFRELTEFS
jgi:hypothetical protein